MNTDKPRILAIDDTPANLLTLGRALENEFDVQISTSGAEGLALAEETPPALILLDIMMPEMDGFETCRRIKASPLLKHVPVIFVTALMELESEAKGLTLGAADYITKPVNVAIAKQRIRNLIEREALRKSVVLQRDELAQRVSELHRSQLQLLQAQSRLGHSEAHLRAIIENEPECIKIVDAAGVIVSMNPAGLAMVEAQSLEQVFGKPVLSIVAPEYRVAFAEMHRRVIGGESAQMEFEVLGVKGGRRWLETHAVPMQDGGQTGHLAITRDITERRQNQQRLEHVLHEQSAMLENELVGIVKVANRTIIWANPAFEKMMGYGRGEMSGMATQSNYIDEAAYVALGAVAYPVLARGGIFKTEHAHVRKNGELIWVQMSGALLDGDTNESLWTFIDISDRKQAEDELRQQLDFGKALNAIAQGIIDGDDKTAILQLTCDIVGKTMALDRVLIYEVSLAQWTASGVCEWLNPAHSDMKPSIGTYSLDLFKDAASELIRTHQCLSSQRADVNLHLRNDGSGALLHQAMDIQSLLWLPFHFEDDSFHVLALNQVFASRQWSDQELIFLGAVGRQVSIALTKIQLLEVQKKSREKIELAASVFTHAREGITITKLDGSIIEVNNAFTRITGYSREEVLGKNPRMLNSGRQEKEFYVNMWRQLLDKGHWYGELWNRRKNGELYAEMLTVTTVHDAAGKPENYVALFTDITAFKEHEDQLEHIAHYDALTNLPNRVLLADRLRQGMVQEQRRGKKLAVVFVDLDGFKGVNDAHGHAMGDKLLVSLASRMKQALREGDTLARIGGDEFVAVLGDLDDVNASDPMLSRLLSATSQAVLIDGVSLQVSASVGVTFYPQAQEVSADQLLRQADQAMYQAKLAGKNRYNIFDSQEDSSIRGFHESIERVRHGLAHNEFVMYYQPKVNMLTGNIIGAEALIRWAHPENGLMAPGLFLPLIENHPVAIELGEWVINTTLQQIEIWQQQGVEVTVSVNVGARQLQQADFVPRLKAILKAHPLVNPSRLEIEILETSALEDLERVSQVIEDCRELGVLFAMDDFGTGYSSLTYLRRLRVNLLKIDQSFVRDMLDDVDDLTILQGVIGLARSFRRSAIAEGVESVAHGKLLLQLGCELAQGFGIARPMPAEALPQWLRSWTPDPSWSAETAIAIENIPLLYAGIEHRTWITAMGEHLRGERVAPPPLDIHQCNFGKWFEGDCQARYGELANVAVIGSLHQSIHALGAELVALQAQGRNAEALEKYPELERLRDALLVELEVLAHFKPPVPINGHLSNVLNASGDDRGSRFPSNQNPNPM